MISLLNPLYPHVAEVIHFYEEIIKRLIVKNTYTNKICSNAFFDIPVGIT